jgi:hypothetical protein
MPMGNYVIGVSNYVIAIRSTLGISVIVHIHGYSPGLRVPGVMTTWATRSVIQSILASTAADISRLTIQRVVTSG